ncbi:hypothetical protein SDC9_146225 [bioreactor metagenome]|uniref:Uncharacterized protein n=1 Tax=bioreactor metagenome TaxID=1076179 RepID=A0A645EC27_9ZZZZ
MKVHMAVHRARQGNKAFCLDNLRAVRRIEPPDEGDFTIMDGDIKLFCSVRQRTERPADKNCFVLHGCTSRTQVDRHCCSLPVCLSKSIILYFTFGFIVGHNCKTYMHRCAYTPKTTVFGAFSIALIFSFPYNLHIVY